MVARMDNANWIAYMEAARGDDNDARTATKLQVSQSAVSRWRTGAQPRPQQVVDFARTYGANALTGLIAAGYINRADLAELGTTVAAPSTLSEISTTELLDELQRRLRDLRDALDRVDNNADHEALAALINALAAPANVGGTTDNHDTLTAEEAAHLLHQNDHALAADKRDGRDEEAEAPTTP